MLSEISQTEKDKYHIFSVMWNIDLKKSDKCKMGGTLWGANYWGD
jgi:hypothetical protein